MVNVRDTLKLVIGTNTRITLLANSKTNKRLKVKLTKINKTFVRPVVSYQMKTAWYDKKRKNKKYVFGLYKRKT